MVDIARLRNGERIAVVAAILLFAFMFLHWFGVKAVNTSNLLFAITSVLPGKNAWKRLTTSRSCCRSRSSPRSPLRRYAPRAPVADLP